MDEQLQWREHLWHSSACPSLPLSKREALSLFTMEFIFSLILYGVTNLMTTFLIWNKKVNSLGGTSILILFLLATWDSMPIKAEYNEFTCKFYILCFKSLNTACPFKIQLYTILYSLILRNLKIIS